MIRLAEYFAIALVLALGLTPLCRWAARRLGVVARPKNDRWHKQATPLFGGIAIAAPALLLGLTIRPANGLPLLLACGGAIAAFGCADDILSLKPSTKLIVQISVASVLLFVGYRLSWTQSMLGDVMLTLFWIVGVTNALNLLDNMDGLCAGVAWIAFVFLLFVMLPDTGPSPAALYLSALLGSTLGFLVYNVHPASIFMGDTGSLFLGVNLAALTLTARTTAPGRSGLVSVIAAPVLLLLIPIFDTTLVTAIRLLSGRSPSRGGRDHTSHRLVALGLPERQAVLVLWALSAGGGATALALRRYGPGWVGIAAALFVLAMVIFAVFLSRIHMYQDADLALLRNGHVTPLVTTLMYKRRIAEVLLDLCLVTLAYYTAYRLRFEGAQFSANYGYFLQSLPIVLSVQLLSLFVVGAYRGSWRYFGMMDAVVFAKSVLGGTIGAQLVVLYLYRFQNYSRAVFVIDATILLLLLAGSRASFRLLGEFINRRRAGGRRCVIYGTDGATLTTIRLAFGDAAAFRIVGFIDDDPRQHRTRVQGYSVLGGFKELMAAIGRGEVDCVVLNGGVADSSRLVALEAVCRDREVSLLRLHVDLKPVFAAP